MFSVVQHLCPLHCPDRLGPEYCISVLSCPVPPPWQDCGHSWVGVRPLIYRSVHYKEIRGFLVSGLLICEHSYCSPLSRLVITLYLPWDYLSVHQTLLGTFVHDMSAHDPVIVGYDIVRTVAVLAS